MTYRDMTFCRAPECIHFKACHRALTERVEADAKALGLPIGEFVNPKQNYCYQPHGLCERERDKTLPAA